MTKINLQPYKGTRDFYPEDNRIQEYIFSVWRKVAERYGYESYDASVLEPLDLYRLKNQENQEIINEQIYSFSDRGGREVAIRPEMTPTVSRMVAGRRQELGYPLRWYSIPNLLRYERPQRGRLREHWQLNVDIFGVDNSEAELELLQISRDIMRGFGAKESMYSIRVNNRNLINYALAEVLKLNDVQLPSMIQLIDKKDKLEPGVFVASCEQILSPTQRDDGLVESLDAMLSATTIEQLPDTLRICPGYLELQELFSLAQSANFVNLVFDMGIMRGFDYYTGNVFEVFDSSQDNNRSMFGGGRYDGLVGAMGVEPIATVGFGMGDVTTRNFLETNGLLPALPSPTDVYVITLQDAYQASLGLVQSMRSEGLSVAVDNTGKKLSKQIDTAAKKGINYVLFVGEEEIAEGRYKLKNIVSGEEETLSSERIVTKLLSKRQALS